MINYYLANKEYDCQNAQDSNYNVGSYDLERFTKDCTDAAADANCNESHVDTGTFKNEGSVYCSQFDRTVKLYYQQMKCKMSDCYEVCPEYGP